MEVKREKIADAQKGIVGHVVMVVGGVTQTAHSKVLKIEIMYTALKIVNANKVGHVAALVQYDEENCFRKNRFS